MKPSHVVVVAVICLHGCASSQDAGPSAPIRIDAPDMLMRTVVHELGVRSLSECEEIARMPGAPLLPDEDGIACIKETGVDIYNRDRTQFRMQVFAAQETLPGIQTAPVVLDGDLRPLPDSTATTVELGCRMVQVLPTAHDQALVNVVQRCGWRESIAETWYSATFRNGWWEVSQAYLGAAHPLVSSDSGAW